VLIACVCGVLLIVVLIRITLRKPRLDRNEIRRLARLGDEMQRRSAFPME
jgi:hypothetical protein